MEKLKLAAAIGLAIFAYVFGYKVATTAADLRFETFQRKAADDYAHLLKLKLDGEKRSEEMRYRIETNLNTELERQRQSYENLLSSLHADTPDGVCDVPDNSGGVPRTEPTPADVVCFGEADLRGRIAKSLEIAHRCDELAIKYNALLKLYEEQNRKLEEIR